MPKFRKGALCVLIAAAFAGTAVAAPCNGPTGSAPAIVPDAPLTLTMALTQIRRASPEVRRAALETRASHADADQVGRRMNPSIGLEVENFSGSGALTGFSQSETTLTIEQTFQLGGKREKRESAARARAALAGAECHVILREAELEAAYLFYEIGAAQEFAELAKEAWRIADQFVETVAKRVHAGAAAPPELERARSDAAILKSAHINAQADVEIKKTELASMWGSASPQFSYIILPADSPEIIAGSDIMSHPDIRAASANEDMRRAEQDAAQSIGIPDVTFSAGFRRFEETGDTGFLLGISVPLPLFDRNQDTVRASGFRTDKARINTAATQARIQARHRAAAIRMDAAKRRLALLEGEALPAARSAYEKSVKGYVAGRFDLTTTLNARKELLNTRIAVIEARRDLNIATSEFRSLSGTPPFAGEF